MKEKQGTLSYSFCMWGVFLVNSYLISQRTSWRTIQVFKYLLSPPTNKQVAFVLPILNPVEELLHGTGQKGGHALKFSWYICF